MNILIVDDSPDYRRLLVRMLAKNPADRYPDALALVDSLSRQENLCC